MIEDIELVEYEHGFLEELVTMWRASFERGVGITDPHPIAEQREYFLSNVIPQNAVRIAVSSGTVLGFVAANEVSVAQLYVHVDHHRRGIGTRMLNWAKSASNGSLWLYTFARNNGAQRFYERHGFEVVERGFEEDWQLEDIKYHWQRE